MKWVNFNWENIKKYVVIAKSKKHIINTKSKMYIYLLKQEVEV